MKKKQIEILPCFIDIVNICNQKNFYVIPVKNGKKYKAVVFQNEKTKEGSVLFNDWEVCQEKTYKTIYKAITS